jgi:cell shape-determining protein MreC
MSNLNLTNTLNSLTDDQVVSQTLNNINVLQHLVGYRVQNMLDSLRKKNEELQYENQLLKENTINDNLKPVLFELRMVQEENERLKALLAKNAEYD